MLHPYVIVAGIGALLLFGASILLLIVQHQGLKLHFEFRGVLPSFDIESSRPKGMTKKEVEKLVDDKVESHLSAIAVYKDGLKQHEENAKILIAHKLDDIKIPESQSISDDFFQILDLTLKMELLLLNIENHYVQSARTMDNLKEYLVRRYERILRIFNTFSSDAMENHRVAYIVFKDWWSIVSSVLVASIDQKRVLNNSVLSVFNESSWKHRVEVDSEELEQVKNNFETADIQEILRDYFADVVQVEVPFYLEQCMRL